MISRPVKPAPIWCSSTLDSDPFVYLNLPHPFIHVSIHYLYLYPRKLLGVLALPNPIYLSHFSLLAGRGVPAEYVVEFESKCSDVLNRGPDRDRDRASEMQRDVREEHSSVCRSAQPPQWHLLVGSEKGDGVGTSAQCRTEEQAEIEIMEKRRACRAAEATRSERRRVLRFPFKRRRFRFPICDTNLTPRVHVLRSKHGKVRNPETLSSFGRTPLCRIQSIAIRSTISSLRVIGRTVASGGAFLAGESLLRLSEDHVHRAPSVIISELGVAW